jgi:microcystin-dependent protein
MSTDPFIGEIKIFGFNFAPINYQLCNGQLLAIQTNAALFSLIGTYYGGNGQTTFGLPNLQGRMPIGQGNSNGQTYVMGEMSGNSNVTLLSSNMPAHVHAAAGINVRIPVATTGEDSAAANNYIGNAVNDTFGPTPSASSLAAPTVSGNTGIAGNGLPFSVQNPYLVINYSIAVYGIFPSRN